MGVGDCGGAGTGGRRAGHCLKSGRGKALRSAPLLLMAAKISELGELRRSGTPTLRQLPESPAIPDSGSDPLNRQEVISASKGP